MKFFDNDYYPQHINAVYEDFEGNDGHGRIVILPGSDGRARDLSKSWDGLTIKTHPRAHNLYTGTISQNGVRVDVAAVSSGMGTPSLDIIVNELRMLGARTFIRLGTSGSLQPDVVKYGDVVIPTASVRDESAGTRYLPLEVPAVPSFDFLLSAYEASQAYSDKSFSTHFGVVHTKDSLMARELNFGPLADDNQKYMDVLRSAGVLASEMETSLLFLLGSLYNNNCINQCSAKCTVGAILSIIGDDSAFKRSDHTKVISNSISFCESVVFALRKKISATALRR